MVTVVFSSVSDLREFEKLRGKPCFMASEDQFLCTDNFMEREIELALNALNAQVHHAEHH